MARRVWVIRKDIPITQEVIDEATANQCPEIAHGIPPALKSILAGKKLPMAYEEPEAPLPEPPRDLIKELDEFKAKLATLERL